MGKHVQTKLPREFQVELESTCGNGGYYLKLKWREGAWKWHDLKTKRKDVALQRIPGALSEMLAELANAEILKAQVCMETAKSLQKLCKEQLIEVIRVSANRNEGNS